jgi:hypothetical protein
VTSIMVQYIFFSTHAERDILPSQQDEDGLRELPPLRRPISGWISSCWLKLAEEDRERFWGLLLANTRTCPGSGFLETWYFEIPNRCERNRLLVSTKIMHRQLRDAVATD